MRTTGGEELQLLQEEVQGSARAPAWSRMWLLWLAVGLLAVAGLAGGARWSLTEAASDENLRGPSAPLTFLATFPAAGDVPAPVEEDPANIVGHMDRKEAHELTRAHSDDDVEVQWLMSPLLKANLGRTAAFFGLYHVGVGFRNKRTGLDTSMEFAAKQFGINLVSPVVDRESKKIIWDRATEYFLQEGELDTGYWTHLETVATIKGDDYNRLLKLLPEIQKIHSKYQMFNLSPFGQQIVQPHLPMEPAADDFPPGGVTCSDVAQLLLDQIRQIAGSEAFNANCADVGRSDAYLWVKLGTKPRKLNMSVEEDFEKVAHFFEVLNKSISGMAQQKSYTLQQLASSSLHTLQKARLHGGIYVDALEDYWSYEFAEMHFAGPKLTSLVCPNDEV